MDNGQLAVGRKALKGWLVLYSIVGLAVALSYSHSLQVVRMFNTWEIIDSNYTMGPIVVLILVVWLLNRGMKGSLWRWWGRLGRAILSGHSHG